MHSKGNNVGRSKGKQKTHVQPIKGNLIKPNSLTRKAQIDLILYNCQML